MSEGRGDFVRCSVLQCDRCVAVCCIVLHCVALCCIVLQCFAVFGSVFQCVAACCSVLQCFAVCCSILQCIAMYCSVLQCVAVCCRVLHSVAVCCSVSRGEENSPTGFAFRFACTSQSKSLRVSVLDKPHQGKRTQILIERRPDCNLRIHARQ